MFGKIGNPLVTSSRAGAFESSVIPSSTVPRRGRQVVATTVSGYLRGLVIQSHVVLFLFELYAYVIELIEYYLNSLVV